MTLVLAGSYNQYKHWLQKHGFDGSKFRLVASESQLEGYDIGTVLILVGTAKIKPLWNYLEKTGLSKVRFLCVEELS